MTTPCDLVAERVALGQPYDEAHVATCERCKRLVALPGGLVATLHKPDPDPGIGFAARMTAGARHRLVVRRRRRIAGVTAAVVATAAVSVVVITREPDAPAIAVVPAHDTPAGDPVQHDPWRERKLDPDVAALAHLANVDRSSHLSAHWGRIQKPLAPYRALLKGTSR